MRERVSLRERKQKSGRECRFPLPCVSQGHCDVGQIYHEPFVSKPSSHALADCDPWQPPWQVDSTFSKRLLLMSIQMILTTLNPLKYVIDDTDSVSPTVYQSPRSAPESPWTMGRGPQSDAPLSHPLSNTGNDWYHLGVQPPSILASRYCPCALVCSGHASVAWPVSMCVYKRARACLTLPHYTLPPLHTTCAQGTESFRQNF